MVKQQDSAAFLHPEVEHEPFVERALGTPHIYALLVEAKRIIGGVPKAQRFEAGGAGSYNFRGVDQVVNACAGPFASLGIVMVPNLLDAVHEIHEVVTSGGRTTKHYRHIVRVEYRFIAAVDASWVSCTVEGEAIDYSDKGTAKAMSVALRIALLQTLSLPTDDPDPDSERPVIESEPVRETSPIVKAHNETLKAWLKEQPDAVQTAARQLIRSMSIPLARNQATDAQLEAIEAHAREVGDDLASHARPASDNTMTAGGE